ncbi:nicotinamide N-methyltransferase [Microcaecilia unicolor]|uniref:Nicotinamide N-methyltransferase-like n=1 Tax=Microcaecilia unicolor TaxID=1415580 RepID=A0A6P7ZP45_9AMPH|nr:nicotinamide N-methyltransferase-like [Microcaecilia unicolor]
MESKFTDKDTYQIDFDPRDYLDTYYGAESGMLVQDGYLQFALRKLAQTFSSGGVKGDLLIDIGSGPAIYQELSACEAFKEIIAADYTEQNLQYFEKWLRNEPGIFDWTPVVKAVCDLEGKSGQLVEKQEKLRRAVKQVIKCDVTKSRPMDPLVLPKADCVLTIGCLECACKDLDTYRNTLKNLSSLLKIGGHIVIDGILGSTYFLCGKRRFSCLTLDEAFMKKAVTEAGFVIEDLEVIHREYNKEQFDLCDYTSIIFLVARKVKEI